MRIGRRAFIAKTLAAGAFFGAGTAAYATGYERHDVDIVRLPLELGLGRPLRVALISDIHFDPFYETAYLKHAFELLEAERPDLLLYAGDFVTHTTERFGEFAELAGSFLPPLGAFAGLGNHDHWTAPRKVQLALEHNGIQVLRNRALPLPGVAGWFIAGLESYWGGRPDTAFLRGYPEDARFVSIVHEPDAWNLLTDPRIRLQVSGHTHGGQVRMPFWGALTLPRWGKLYCAGLYGGGGRHLYVSRGLGTVNMRVRFCCRPEITVFELS